MSSKTESTIIEKLSRWKQLVVPIIFSACLILSAFLLFWVELLFAKQILPYLGGVPAAWTGCMVFFQTVLLLGYAWAFFLKGISDIKVQYFLQIGLILIACILLPLNLRIASSVSPEGQPAAWLFITALFSLGLPFFLLASLTPLLQSWLSKFSANLSPYFLYAVSNTGSILGLIAFLFVLEIFVDLEQQTQLWKILFATNFVLLLFGILAAKTTSIQNEEKIIEIPRLRTQNAPNKKQISYWIFFSFIPSSLLLGTTNYISTDLAPVPLFWAVPLIIYLASFILVFAPKPFLLSNKKIGFYLTAITVAAIVYTTFANPKEKQVLIIILLHLFLLFLICWQFHGNIVERKPDSKYLTTFYLAIAFGGMLGGLFNSILAPIVFNGLYEYPIVILLSLFLLIPKWKLPQINFKSFQFKAVLYELSTFLSIAFIVCLLINLLLSAFLFFNNKSINQHRSFFGVYRIMDIASSTDSAGFRQLVHGSTIHGKQYKNKRNTPALYYADQEPIADIFNSDSNFTDVGIIGLGTGGLLSYSKTNQHWDYYEIDPTILEIAKSDFYYIEDSPAKIDIKIGDGRLKLNQSNKKYDLFIIDAFNSDSIPVHLLTKEAFEIYKKHLSEKGFIVFHISNQYLDLTPIIQGLADSDKNFTALYRRGKGSQWTVVAQDKNKILKKLKNKNWKEIEDSKLWTDNHSNIFSVLKFTKTKNSK